MLPQTWNFIDKILYLSEYDTIIASDIHIGSGDILNTLDRLFTVIDTIQPTTVILNGDLYYLHCAQSMTDAYHSTLKKFIKALILKVDTVVYLEGNHELHSEVYPKIVKDLNVKTGLYHQISDIIVTHGHSSTDKTGTEYIIGHIHPKKQNTDVYHYKINTGQYKNVTILPAFSNNVDRADIDTYTGRCPILNEKLNDYSFKYIHS